MGARNKMMAALAGLVVVGLITGGVLALTRSEDGNDKASRPSSAATTATSGPRTSPTTATTTTAAGEDLIAASGFGDPGAVDIPDPVDPAATVDYLNGPGATLLTFREQIQPLLDNQDPTRADCTALADELENGPSPEDLLGAATETPDEPTRDLLTTLVTATPRALASCGTDDLAPRAELAWQVAVLDRRLAELGIA